MEKSYSEMIRQVNTGELADILANINKEKYPERYLLVKAEIENRKNPDYLPPSKIVESVNLKKGMYDTTFQRFIASGIDGTISWVATACLYLAMGMGIPNGQPIDGVIIRTLYTIGATWWFSKTLGKHIMGLIVIDHKTRKAISFKQAFIRDIGSIISIIIIIIAITWKSLEPGNGPMLLLALAAIGASGWTILELVTMFSNAERRAFHDKIAGTSVVIKKMI